eukprot:701570-Hanusia_phi.AAC.1
MPSDHDRTRINMIISDHGRASDPRRSDPGRPRRAGPADHRIRRINHGDGTQYYYYRTVRYCTVHGSVDSADPARTVPVVTVILGRQT